MVKKLSILLALALVTVVAVDAHRGYNGDSSCKTGSCGTRSCGDRCKAGCNVCSEVACAPAPDCVKTVQVKTPACKHKHVSYTWTCPTGYTEEVAKCAPYNESKEAAAAA